MAITSGIIDTPKAAPPTHHHTSSTSDQHRQRAGGPGQIHEAAGDPAAKSGPAESDGQRAMTSQLAQLSTVTGINKVNATLESLRTDMASPVADAINLIGKGVLVAGKGIELSADRRSGKTTSSSVFGVDLPSAANAYRDPGQHRQDRAHHEPDQCRRRHLSDHLGWHHRRQDHHRQPASTPLPSPPSGGTTLTATPCNWRPWPACRPAAAASN
jgi:hypothetical protein